MKYLAFLKKQFNSLNMQYIKFDLLKREKIIGLNEKTKLKYLIFLIDILKLNLETENIKHDTPKIKKLDENCLKPKHYPSSVREWNNSIYLYNKSNLNLIPSSAVKAMKIIKGFFYMYNSNIEAKTRSKKLRLRFRKLSSNRIYLSKAEFKHNNNNVLINIYLFNRQKYNYLSKLKNIFLLKSFQENKIFNKSFIKLLKIIYFKGLSNNKTRYKKISSYLKIFSNLNKNRKIKIDRFKYFYDYTIKFYKYSLRYNMMLLRLYFYYKQLIYINKFKLNYNYLRLLKKRLEILYNKNVEFNLINLKLFYLNSDILSESVKLKLTKNRKKMRSVLKNIKNKIKISKKPIFLGFNTQIVENIQKIKHTNLLKKQVLSKLKYRHVSGYRLEAKGRLSKRHTASRSVHKVDYKGNLLNMDSSFRKLSCVILKGNLRSNLQYTKVRSKTRIGSYGLKG